MPPAVQAETQLLLNTIACALAASVVMVATVQERIPQLDATVQAFLKAIAVGGAI